MVSMTRWANIGCGHCSEGMELRSWVGFPPEMIFLGGENANALLDRVECMGKIIFSKTGENIRVDIKVF